MTNVERYVEINKFGYRIDIRGAYPLLIRGQWEAEFKTWEEALEYAEQMIKEVKK